MTRDEYRRGALDLAERDLSADAPDELYVADITYIPTWSGFLYLVIVLDVLSRWVGGWSMTTDMRIELVLDALEMALWQPQLNAVIHHSDQGCSIPRSLSATAAGPRGTPLDGIGWRLFPQCHGGELFRHA